MDEETILALGKFLSEVIDGFDTCDHTLGLTEVWLKANEHEKETTLNWLHDQGISCDCEFVLKLYIPVRDKGKPRKTLPINPETT